MEQAAGPLAKKAFACVIAEHHAQSRFHGITSQPVSYTHLAALKESLTVYKDMVDKGILAEYTDWDQYIASMLSLIHI